MRFNSKCFWKTYLVHSALSATLTQAQFRVLNDVENPLEKITNEAHNYLQRLHFHRGRVTRGSMDQRETRLSTGFLRVQLMLILILNTYICKHGHTSKQSSLAHQHLPSCTALTHQGLSLQQQPRATWSLCLLLNKYFDLISCSSPWCPPS